jgi:putative Holliday junction resolvase
VRYLGLDIGDRWIGLAAGDAASGIASPLRTLRRSSLQADVAVVRRAYEQEGAGAVVIGLPYNMDGSLGPQARRTLRFADVLRHAGLDVVFCDERLSSVAAVEYVTATRGRRPKSGERIDHVAAAVILQDYLDGIGHAGALHAPDVSDAPAMALEGA